MHMVNTITHDNLTAVNYVEDLLLKHTRVGAFQTRNIPHFGHERILERLMDECDHLVVNPVIGPNHWIDHKMITLIH